MTPSSLPPTLSPVALNLKTKLAYGTGELSSEVPGSILTFFVLFFLTNVAGLNPALAGSVLLVANVWDAVLDPVVGYLSDRTQSPWGKRYPWMLAGSLPLGISFFLFWLVPPLPNQGWLFGYYIAIAMVFYTAYTMVVIPFSTLGAELTQTYHERTHLISFKAAFSIGSSIFALVLAQLILGAVPNIFLRYALLGGICGAIACLAVYVCIWGTRSRFQWMQQVRTPVQAPPRLALLPNVWSALRTGPFWFVVGIYLCSWLGVQVTAAILPYFVVNYMGLSEVHFTQMALAVQGTAFLAMSLWGWLGQRIGKQAIYLMGIPLTLIAQGGLFMLQPGQVAGMYGLGILAGFGLATAYIVPWSMLPDVVDLDELNTGQRREGVFYGFVVQLQKIAVAIALFLVGKTLDWAGFVSTTGSQSALQPDTALNAIRWLVGPIPSVVLIGGLVLVVFYPISKPVHDRILIQLSDRRIQSSSSIHDVTDE
ncbi:MFS transporter [Leptolyngbya sp. CCY15150]|uniref:MFS transporter n=1 Tax=Leptolyngbya sp. CCY15150 TaxID=2767772 RepID=UPI00195185CA|nr:MFS transporter [Leptolyngbya sp. CCY15150]